MAKYKVTIPINAAQKLETESNTKNIDKGSVENDKNKDEKSTDNNLNTSESTKPNINKDMLNNIKSKIQSSVSDKIKNGILNFLKKKPKPDIKEDYRVKPAVIQS